MKNFLAVLAIILGLSALAVSSNSKADEIYVTLCGEEITQWFIRDDAGIEVMAAHSALLQSKPMKMFLLEVNATKPTIFFKDACAEEEPTWSYGGKGLLIGEE